MRKTKEIENIYKAKEVEDKLKAKEIEDKLKTLIKLEGKLYF